MRTEPAPVQESARPVRFAKFSLVGLIGIGVQLAALAVLTQAGVDYRIATVLAVESAVLHNFVWHQRFTWAGRTGAGLSQALRRLARFHLGNGAVSILGNLLLMRLLVGSLQIPVIPANLATILACSLANFLVSDEWVFLASPESEYSGDGAGAVVHQQKRALGEGNIEQRSSSGQRQTNADFARKQKRGQRPQPVQEQKWEEQSLEAMAEVLDIEGHGGQQIEPYRDADDGADDQDGGNPCRTAEDLLQQVLHLRQPRQRNHVEDEIHYLDEGEQGAQVMARSRR